jgi:hypothetical protein
LRRTRARLSAVRFSVSFIDPELAPIKNWEMVKSFAMAAQLRCHVNRFIRLLVARIREGEDIAAKAEVAERSAGYRDWLHLFTSWRIETITQVKGAYEGREIALEFEVASEIQERGSPKSTFDFCKIRSTTLGD